MANYTHLYQFTLAFLLVNPLMMLAHCPNWYLSMVSQIFDTKVFHLHLRTYHSVLCSVGSKTNSTTKDSFCSREIR